uniref:Amino acid ABC transporter permease n=1 Tax=Candidatus Aschnera chinzeii TaxID=1485666 RepID=A0AAT9G4W2_9ENTR|nr:MAG: amino acid ABC transporter permease [Candidatus Aschnera chinzeii]
MMNLLVIMDNYRYLLLGNFPSGPLAGAGLTLLITVLSGIVSIIFGFICGIALIMFKGIWRNILFIFIEFLRAIPVLMLIFWTYFLLPIIFTIEIPELLTIVIALSFITSAYLAHIVKSGILSIKSEQWQAGISLGFTRWGVLWNIILPQSLCVMIPSFVNQFITLTKDTSLGYIIGIAELTFVANQINNREMIYPIEIFLFVAIIYFFICYIIEYIGYILMLKLKNYKMI